MTRCFKRLQLFLQVFIRRILQVSAELQDARDAIHQICQPPRLTQRQCDLILTTNNDSYLDDPSHDPSVRFFGVEWEQIFNKCFSLTLNLQIFRTQVLNSVPLDLVLLNSILKDLARVEVDVTSHGEAVLHGRLSKSQQQLIKQEQSRLNSMVPPPQPKVSKSRSFRDSSISGSQRRQRQISKYKKNKTTDLHKLQDQSSQPTTVTTTNANDNMVGPTINIIDNNNEKSTGSIEDEWQQVMRDASSTRRKSSFIQNVSSIFKNIR